MAAGEISKEGTRQLIDIAISSGRKHQSAQTGFVHYCYNKEDEKDNATIPVYENLLFALALMRAKSTDFFQEGKQILEKILAFQNFSLETGKGGFPVYLHEYPHCKDRLLGIRLLPALCSILLHYHSVLGSPCKTTLTSAIENLLNQSLQTHQEKPAPFASAYLLGSVTEAFGLFSGRPELVEAAQEIFSEQGQVLDHRECFSPGTLSELLVAFQLKSEPEKEEGFWQFLSDSWHPDLCSYIGPGWREFQSRQEPQPTLYDLYMGFATGNYSYRAFVEHLYQLQSALIFRPHTCLASAKTSIQGAIGVNSWFIHREPFLGVCLLGKKEPLTAGAVKGYHPLKILWGNRNYVHSFVNQGGNLDAISYEWHPNGYIGMEVCLGPCQNTEDKEKARELIFYTEALEDVRFTVGNIPTTTFTLQDTLAIHSKSMTLRLTFQIMEGEGSFLGHVMKGNRLSQICVKGDHRLDVYDWQIFLRTIARSPDCKIKIGIAIVKEEE